MTPARPDPDELLAQVQAEEVHARRGAVKIFFGYAAGVGKTYTMLEAARQARAEGRDVVIGYVEPHERPETEALLEGLEVIPTRQVEYRGVLLREFDVDAGLARRPEVLLVDELAHTNSEGSRHAKRWQDVEELRQAGIQVWTTLNVQHIESLNDVIGQVTGIRVRETVPDHVFDSTDDLGSWTFLPRNCSRVYRPERSTFPSKPTGNASFSEVEPRRLAEMSFRHAAQRLHSDVESVRRQKAVPSAMGDGGSLAGLRRSKPHYRAGDPHRKTHGGGPRRPLDRRFRGSWRHGGQPRQERIARHFRLAEQLGGDGYTLGQDVAATILDFARSRNVTKIFIGKTHQPRWKRLLARSSTAARQQRRDRCLRDPWREGFGREGANARRMFQSGWLPHVFASGVAAAGALAALFTMLTWPRPTW